jgi:hypothetical protein
LVETFLGFAHNYFEEQQAATCHFSKVFCENPGNVSTNRKKGITIQKCIHSLTSKEFCEFNSIWC